MIPTVFYNRPANQWFSEAIDFLVDRPLDGLLANSLFSLPDNHFRQTPDGYTLEVAVPGMSKKDLQIEVDNQVLTIKGQKQQKNNWSWLYKSSAFVSTQVYKTFVLPEDAEVDGIQAKCKEGLLKISIPKVRPESSRKVIPIAITAEPNRNIWQKLMQPFKALWLKISNKWKQLKLNF